MPQPQTLSKNAVSVRLSPEIRCRLHDLAEVRRSSASSLVVQAVTSFLDREEKREAIRRECIAAHEEYMRTGLHVTGDEVDAWVDRLLKGEKAEFPECHA